MCIRDSNIPESCLPKVYDSNHCFGYTSASITQKEIPIHAVLGDQQASLFAQCGEDTSKLKNTYGTGLFLVAYTGKTVPVSDQLISTVAWQRDGTIHYALEGSIFVGGSAIQWLRDELGLIKDASETAAMAESLSSSEGAVSYTHLTLPTSDLV